MHTPNGPVAQPNEAPRTRMEPLAGNVHSSPLLGTPSIYLCSFTMFHIALHCFIYYYKFRGPPGPKLWLVALWAGLTLSFAPFGRSGRVTLAMMWSLDWRNGFVSMRMLSVRVRWGKNCTLYAEKGRSLYCRTLQVEAADSISR